MSSGPANGIWDRGVCWLVLLVCFHFYNVCSYFLRVLIFPGQREMKDVYGNHFEKLPLVRSAPSILVRPDSRALDRLLPKHEAIIMIFICISKKNPLYLPAPNGQQFYSHEVEREGSRYQLLSVVHIRKPDSF